MSALVEQRYGRRWTYPLVIALVCVVGLLRVDSGAIAAGKPVRHTVVIEAMKYAPDTLTIKRGDIVVWINKDSFPHTVTANGGFDSHDIAASRSWNYMARIPGKFAYTCKLHSTMNQVQACAFHPTRHLFTGNAKPAMGMLIT